MPKSARRERLLEAALLLIALYRQIDQRQAQALVAALQRLPSRLEGGRSRGDRRADLVSGPGTTKHTIDHTDRSSTGS